MSMNSKESYVSEVNSFDNVPDDGGDDVPGRIRIECSNEKYDYKPDCVLGN